MKLILDTLERARLAASPSDALALADALTDMEALGAAMRRNGWPLDDVPAVLDNFKALRDHVNTQPFETTDMADGTTTVESLTPDAFPHWLADLEGLAQ